MTPFPPETVAKKCAPGELMARLNRMRELYTHGVLTADQFNAFLSEYRFRDEHGGLWSPGGRTGKWYLWTGTTWVASTPPAQLWLDGLDRSAHGEKTSRPERACPKCGAHVPSRKKFCTTCGTEVPLP